jgi:transcriptional regulator with XRE-family HTH domain
MSFRFDVGARARTASRLIGNLRSDLIAAVLRHRDIKDLSQQQLAESIGISRTDLNGLLSGKSELTLRSLSDIALALDKEVVVELRDPDRPGNHFVGEEFQVPAVGRMKSRDAVTRSSSRAMRTFVTHALSTDRDD